MLDFTQVPLKKGAVTGGLSSGKSSVCRFFQELGAYVVSADEIVHELLSTNQELKSKIVKLLGQDILINNRIDRVKVAKKVFNQPLLLKSLESILHPVVLEEIKKCYELKQKEGQVPLFIAEIPLLFEIKAESFFDFTIAVIADVNSCIDRFKRTTHYDEEEFRKRTMRQFSNQKKSEKANYTIFNNGSLKDLQHASAKLYKQILDQNN